MEKINKQKKIKRKWLFILIPIIVLAIAAGIAYGIVDYKLGLKQSDPKKQLVNAVIKDAIENPTEIKGILDSVTVKGQAPDENGSDKGSTGSNAADQNKNNANEGTAATKANENGTNGSATSSIEDLKKNYSDYALLSSNAVNLGGNTYHLTATVKNKKTGEIKTVEVTTKLSESTKNMLKNYRNSGSAN